MCDMDKIVTSRELPKRAFKEEWPDSELALADAH